jgi:hypothetical protein
MQQIEGDVAFRAVKHAANDGTSIATGGRRRTP